MIIALTQISKLKNRAMGINNCPLVQAKAPIFLWCFDTLVGVFP